MNDDSKLMHRDITDPIIGAFYEVYNALPYGLPEKVFHRAMQVALRKRGLKFETQKPLRVYFCGELVGRYRADLIVEARVIVELKTAVRIVDAYLDQLAGYLQIAQLQVGLVMNFGPEPTFKRYFRDVAPPGSVLTQAPNKSVNPKNPEFPKSS